MQKIFIVFPFLLMKKGNIKTFNAGLSSELNDLDILNRCISERAILYIFS
jgi:hypothetical protein